MQARTLLFLIVCIMMGLTQTCECVEPPDSLWSVTYGGADYDVCFDAIQSSDGGFLQVGGSYTFSIGDEDGYLVKTSSSGSFLWSKIYGGLQRDHLWTLIQTSDGGYLLGGGTYSFGSGSENAWAVKTNASGDTVWTRAYGGNHYDRIYDVIEVSDGYFLGGYTYSYGAGGADFWVIKTDFNGIPLFTRTFGGPGQDYCHFITEAVDGDIVLAGYTDSFGAGEKDFWLVKMTDDGDSVLSRTYGSVGSDQCRGGAKTSDGGYVLTGTTDPDENSISDIWLVRTAYNGDSLWSGTYGGGASDWSLSVEQTPEGGFILTGATYSYNPSGSTDAFLLKVAENGSEVWFDLYGGTGIDEGHAAARASDGGYFMAGNTRSFGGGEDDLWLVKTGTENPYMLFVYPLQYDDFDPILRWIAPYTSDYIIYSTTNPNHDGSPPGPDWTIEDVGVYTMGHASWRDNFATETYKNYIVVVSFLTAPPSE